MTAVLSEISISCVRAGCEIQPVSYASKHALQSFSDKPFPTATFIYPGLFRLHPLIAVWTRCSPQTVIKALVSSFFHFKHAISLSHATRMGGCLSHMTQPPLHHQSTSIRIESASRCGLTRTGLKSI